MRFCDRTIGARNLFRATGSPLADHDLDIGQAMADVATAAILQPSWPQGGFAVTSLPRLFPARTR